MYVAPRAGAWIETMLLSILLNIHQSRPARARGLKHGHIYFPPLIAHVAPRAGAWIETSFAKSASICWMSRPARARGLKPVHQHFINKVHCRAPRGRVD